MVCLKCLTPTLLLILSFALHVLADAGADPAFDKWNFGMKKFSFSGAPFNKKRFRPKLVDEVENISYTESLDSNHLARPKSDPIPQTHNHILKSPVVNPPHPSINQSKKINSFEVFVETMISPSTVSTKKFHSTSTTPSLVETNPLVPMMSRKSPSITAAAASTTTVTAMTTTIPSTQTKTIATSRSLEGFVKSTIVPTSVPTSTEATTSTTLFTTMAENYSKPSAGGETSLPITVTAAAVLTIVPVNTISTTAISKMTPTVPSFTTISVTTSQATVTIIKSSEMSTATNQEVVSTTRTVATTAITTVHTTTAIPDKSSSTSAVHDDIVMVATDTKPVTIAVKEQTVIDDLSVAADSSDIADNNSETFAVTATPGIFTKGPPLREEMEVLSLPGTEISGNLDIPTVAAEVFNENDSIPEEIDFGPNKTEMPDDVTIIVDLKSSVESAINVEMTTTPMDDPTSSSETKTEHSSNTIASKQSGEVVDAQVYPESQIGNEVPSTEVEDLAELEVDESVIKDEISALLPIDLEADLAKFGILVTSTTVDPISEILANVVILDVNPYLPKGYDFGHEETEEEEIAEHVENINNLLIKKEEESNIKLRPGKLYGKQLAAVTKKLEDAKKDQKDERRKGKQISDASLELSAESIFASILGGEEIQINPVTETVEPSSPQTTSPPIVSTAVTIATRIITTVTPRSTTPGVCGEFCSLAGTIFIKSGLEWSEELLHTSTDVYKEITEEMVREMTKVFQFVYFGSAFEFCAVEAFSRRDEEVLVDFYVQFSGIVFNVTTKDIKDSFRELLEVEDSKLMMGKFDIDIDSTYFLVVETSVPLETITFEKYGVILPDWAWLVVVGGVISTFIIGFFGVIMGVSKYRHNQVVKTKLLNPKTLQQFRGQRHFDEVDVDYVTAYATDKRDMWTLQKVHQVQLTKSKTSLNKKFGYADSGRGSGMSGSGKGFYERFPSIGKGGNSRVNPNDSNAELLGRLDSTGFDDSRDIIEDDVVDKDTSTENKEYEGNVVDFDQHCSNLSRANLLQNLSDQGIAFYDSDGSSVSDGPSERI